MNECYFMGNLGRDPVVKCTQTGKTYARFSIGCSEKWGDKEITNWVNVVCWDNVAQAVGNYLSKGKLVMVKGRWTSRKYTDQKTGEVKYTTELNAQVVSIPIGLGKQAAGEPPISVNLAARRRRPLVTSHFDRRAQNAIGRIV